MSKLINEDWEHAAYANDEIYRAERNHKMELEYEQWKYEQWKYEQESKNKKPAIIEVKKHKDNETAHKPKNIQRDNKKEL